MLLVIIGKNITKSYTGKIILNNIEFKLGNNLKIGIVGKNGCGKTTLFKVILGIEEIEEGNIVVEGEKISYIPQEFNFPNELVGVYLEKKLEYSWDSYKIDMLVEKLDFNSYNPYQEIHTLSEGQKMKVKMVEVLLEEPSIIFIDEPTNHLDIEGIIWFEKYLKKLNKTIVMISHDREFLNNTVDEIWEIEDTNLFRFVGDYDNYKQEKLKLVDKWDEEYRLFLKKKDKLEKLLKNVHKIKDGKSRGNAIKSTKKRIARELEGDNKVEKYETKKMKDVNFSTDITHSKLITRFEDVSKSYGKKEVFKNLNFEIRGGEKVWLFGPNGYGKSTIVKMIMGEEKNTSGEIIIGNNLKVGYFAQKQTKLDYDTNLLDYFIKETGCAYGKSFGFLKSFLFTKEQLQQKIKHLSPGQRARYAFAIFTYNDYDFLILDEPSNHLDIETKEVIEKSLRDFNGTVLLVSHDRFFVERVGINKILNLQKGNLSLY